MIDQFERLHTETAAAVAGLRPEALTTAEADRVLAALTAVATLAAAGELLVMARAVEGETLHAAKARLARRGGTSAGEAESLVKASQALGDLPVVAAAVQAGQLSRGQARIVIDTAAEVPAEQSALLAAATTEDLKGLRDRCAAIRARADRDPAGTRARQRRARSVRMWTGRDGCHHGSWCLPAEGAAEFEGALHQWVDLVLRHAPTDPDATIDNRRADALLAMARASLRQRGHPDPQTSPTPATAATSTSRARSASAPFADAGPPRTGGGAGPPGEEAPGPSAAPAVPDGWLDALPPPIAKEVVVVVDIITLAAAMTGTVDHLAPDCDGQRCELRGFGPVAPEVAKLFMDDVPFLKVVLTEGCDVRIVKHFGRKAPAHFLTAWRLMHPTCDDPGCNNCRGLEGDHLVPDALDGPISLATYRPKCRASHRDKTRSDVTAIASARAGGFQNMTQQERAAHNEANRRLAFDPDPHAYQRFLDLEAAAAPTAPPGTTSVPVPPSGHQETHRPPNIERATSAGPSSSSGPSIPGPPTRELQPA